MDASPEFAEGELVANRYTLGRALGRGGQGHLLAARDELLGRSVALKMMPAIREPQMVSRFLREARTVAVLSSEHIVKILDMGTHHGAPYMVLERLTGSDLSQLIEREGPVPVERAVDYVIQACEGLAHAHAQGVVHRDIKPANLFLAEEPDGRRRVKVVDFGIAKAEDVGPEMELTNAGVFLGSPAYMSPEQIRSPASVDARTDIWSLGVALFFLVTGKKPFAADTMNDVVEKVLSAEVPTLASVGGRAPPGLDGVLSRCLAREPQERYRSVLELATALATFSNDKSSMLVRIAFVLDQAKKPVDEIVGARPIDAPTLDLLVPVTTEPTASIDVQVTEDMAPPAPIPRSQEPATTQRIERPWRSGVAIAVASFVVVLAIVTGFGVLALRRPAEPSDPVASTPPPPPPVATAAPSFAVAAVETASARPGPSGSVSAEPRARPLTTAHAHGRTPIAPRASAPAGESTLPKELTGRN